MHECDHCSESFEDEEPYLEHVRDEHEEDLGPIEQRRVDAMDDGSDGVSGFVYAAVAVVGLVLLGGVAVGLLSGGGGGGGTGQLNDSAAQQPVGLGTVHEHGGMTVTIDGRSLDFSQPEFQRARKNPAFHYERGNGDRWHGHAEGVTLEYALESLGIDVAADALAFDGSVYRSSEGDTVRYVVNGEPVDPTTYELQEGDQVEVVATSNASA